MNSLTYWSGLKKDLWSKFRLTRHNPESASKITTDPRSTVIDRTNPQSVRFSRPNPSIRKPIHPPPPGSLDVGAPSLPSCFKLQVVLLFQLAQISVLPGGQQSDTRSEEEYQPYTWWFLVWRTWCVSAIMVEIDETEDENDGWPDQPHCRSITGINHVNVM